jgi:four helix bundle protein
MAGARHFRELDCWQLAYALKLGLLEVTRRPAARADVTFCDQLRDAARSAPRNIAEGFGRKTDADFAHFLDIARGSLNECQHHLRDALDERYIDANDFERLDVLAKRTCGAVAGLQRHLRRKRR